jgi:hypothetical protein
VISEDDIRSLTPSQRQNLMMRLIDPDRLPDMGPDQRRYRAVFMRVVAVSALLLIPWIVYLANRLPRRYSAAHWDLAWLGFDFALLVTLGITAWAAWRRRQIVIVFSLVAGTLLICDAWFDVMTSHVGHDRTEALLSAVLVELPLAILLLTAAYRLVRLSARTMSTILFGRERVAHLWQMPLLTVQVQELLVQTGSKPPTE